jgi:putative tryptophan/tyrosine transport system substrate-binding protein
MNRSKQAGMGMKTIIVLLIGLVLASVRLAGAQQPKNLPRVGVLAGGRGLGSAGDAFRQVLRELGWIENQNIIIQSQLAEVNLDKLPHLAADLVRLKVAVIVADGDPAISAARQASKTIPIVLVAVGDPVRDGIVASLARPGGNITGLTSISEDLSGKRLELVTEAFPKSRRIAVLWNSSNLSNALEFKETESAARAFGVTLQSLKVQGLEEFRSALTSAARDRPNALIVVRDTLIDSQHFQILDFVMDKRLPSMHGERQFVEAGALMSYGPSRIELFRRAAYYVDKILKGAKPQDLPVEQPTKFEFIINLKTAKQIGVTIPPNMLARADKVIK